MIEDKIEHIKWENISNNNIRNKLIELKNEHESLKSKIINLSEKLDTVEKEYLLGNKTLIKRLKGIE
jgi:hypothetical protein